MENMVIRARAHTHKPSRASCALILSHNVRRVCAGTGVAALVWVAQGDRCYALKSAAGE